ncbi:MAG: hypothetical protein AAF081_19150, partial [Actinomycetota bacterium]
MLEVWAFRLHSGECRKGNNAGTRTVLTRWWTVGPIVVSLVAMWAASATAQEAEAPLDVLASTLLAELDPVESESVAVTDGSAAESVATPVQGFVVATFRATPAEVATLFGEGASGAVVPEQAPSEEYFVGQSTVTVAMWCTPPAPDSPPAITETALYWSYAGVPVQPANPSLQADPAAGAAGAYSTAVVEGVAFDSFTVSNGTSLDPFANPLGIATFEIDGSVYRLAALPGVPDAVWAGASSAPVVELEALTVQRTPVANPGLEIRDLPTVGDLSDTAQGFLSELGGGPVAAPSQADESPPLTDDGGTEGSTGESTGESTSESGGGFPPILVPIAVALLFLLVFAWWRWQRRGLEPVPQDPTSVGDPGPATGATEDGPPELPIPASPISEEDEKVDWEVSVLNGGNWKKIRTAAPDTRVLVEYFVQLHSTVDGQVDQDRERTRIYFTRTGTDNGNRYKTRSDFLNDWPNEGEYAEPSGVALDPNV